MWQILKDIIVETANIFNDVAFFLLIGLLLAGLIKQLLPVRFLRKHLGQKNTKSVLKASLIGVPLPLCSCSVLPTAVAIKKQGASNGATISFLISTPETGVDSISVTYSLLDPIYTIFRPIAAFFTAFAAGNAVNLMEKTDEEKEKKVGKASKHRLKSQSFHDPEEERYESFYENVRYLFSTEGLKSTFNYIFEKILAEIADWLVIGMVFAGAITVLVPSNFFEKYLSDPLLSMLIMIVIGVPLYICAIGSTPVAAALILKGLNPGAALVFLLVGPATNIGSFFVLSKYIKKRYLIIYLIALILVAVVMGLILNLFYAPGELAQTISTEGAGAKLPGWISITASFILILLIAKAFYHNKVHIAVLNKTRKIVTALGLKPKIAFRMGIALIIILYVLSGFFTVNIGQTAIVTQFGKVTDVISKPGLQYKLPYPFTKVIYENHEQIHILEIGFRSEIKAEELLLKTENQLMAIEKTNKESDIPTEGIQMPEEGLIFTGDENIINFNCTMHYQISNPYKYIYKTTPDTNIIRSSLLSSIRRVLNSAELMEIIVNRRAELEKEIEKETKALLKELDIGVKLIQINFTNLHAPPNVHYYFRDVASSMEDKQRVINNAQKYYLDTTIRSKGEAAKIMNEADSYKLQKLSAAEGESKAFLDRYSAYTIDPTITRFRLYIEAAETCLSDITAIFMLKFKYPRAAELWLNTNEKTVFLPYNAGKE